MFCDPLGLCPNTWDGGSNPWGLPPPDSWWDWWNKENLWAANQFEQEGKDLNNLGHSFDALASAIGIADEASGGLNIPGDTAAGILGAAGGTLGELGDMDEFDANYIRQEEGFYGYK